MSRRKRGGGLPARARAVSRSVRDDGSEITTPLYDDEAQAVSDLVAAFSSRAFGDLSPAQVMISMGIARAIREEGLPPGAVLDACGYSVEAVVAGVADSN